VASNTPGGLLQTFLMSSYLYYRCDTQVISDADFDKVCTELLAVWNTFEHQHKHLVTQHDLKAGSGYALRNYPLMVIGAALAWKRSTNGGGTL